MLIKKGKNNTKYKITLEVTDRDIEMLEDLATAYVNVGSNRKKNPVFVDLQPKYSTWLRKTFKIFNKWWIFRS